MDKVFLVLYRLDVTLFLFLNDDFISAINNTRSIVRRSSKEAGAPAGIVYIDSHVIAANKGNVNSVSFYVDRTCALATVEFGAFDLIDRNLDLNEARLVLTHTSGPLKLGVTKALKPYMHLITIRLCSDKAVDNVNDGSCKGSQFPVLPHQYLGVRSDTCRLGYTLTPDNHLLATTWKLADVSDPFDQPYQTLNYIPSDYTILQSVTINSSESKSNQRISELKSTTSTAPRVLFIGSYPPRQCGLAKFLEDLTENYPSPYNVVAVDEQNMDPSSRNYSDKVIFRLNQQNRDAYYTVADIVNSEAYDVFNLQHEFNLYGGMVGEYVINLLASIKKPVITTLHTIPSNPNTFYMSMTRAICVISTRIIVLAECGRQLLIDVYGVNAEKISVIPHGVPDSSFAHSLADAKTKLGLEANMPMMTTFGLLHRNKNIELVLKAMQKVVKSVPNVMYLIIGQTHPLVKIFEKESYRQELENNVTAYGLTNNVRFINKYVDDNELLAYLDATDIFLTPYSNEDQYVSGTLSWAVGLGKGVISTPYIYAKELLDNGRGFLTPFNDHFSLSSLIINLFQNDDILSTARYNAYAFGRQMIWPV
ncbi:unnamed protein product, partial [Rotaria sp. Silwood2]